MSHFLEGEDSNLESGGISGKLLESRICILSAADFTLDGLNVHGRVQLVKE